MSLAAALRLLLTCQVAAMPVEVICPAQSPLITQVSDPYSHCIRREGGAGTWVHLVWARSQLLLSDSRHETPSPRQAPSPLIFYPCVGLASCHLASQK